jgi:hypothetical protein
MEKILGRELTLAEVEDRIIKNFVEVFGFEVFEELRQLAEAY